MRIYQINQSFRTTPHKARQASIACWSPLVRKWAMLLWGSFLPSPVVAASVLNWSGESFFVMTRGMKVSKILEDLGANYGVPVIVSHQVDEIFVGTLKDQTPEEILENLSSLYHLIWYFDGRTLHVCRASEIAQVVLMPKYMSLETLTQYLSETDVLDPRSWSIKKVPGFNAFELVGPPAFISKVKALVAELDEHAANLDENRETIEIFPLKHAQAEDQTYQYKESTITLPGVASLLTEMTKNSDNQNKMQGQFSQNRELPLISADRRKNAVVIKDLALNLEKYRKLIADLDQAQEQIEISVTIIDVDFEDSTKLGLNFALNLETEPAAASFEFSDQSLANGAVLSTQNGASFSSKITDCASFNAVLNALRTESRAQVVAQPSILTLNNTKAILDKSITFYAKIASSDDAKLESITSGTLLEVTPALVPGESNGQVRLQIHLKDGKLDNRDMQDGLPQVQDSEIITQAVLNSGEGLLLGGFVREETTERKREIPGLGQLPWIGRLFSSEFNSSQKIVRLFFIKAAPIALQSAPLNEQEPKAEEENPKHEPLDYRLALQSVQREAAAVGWQSAQSQSGVTHSESSLNSENSLEEFSEDEYEDEDEDEELEEDEL